MEKDSHRRGEVEVFGSRPELPTTAHWRMSMRSARESAGLSQSALGSRVGCSQNVISKIESGEQEASEHIIAISKVLSISLPYALFSDDLDERWFRAGMILRQRGSEKIFRAQVEAMEAMAASLARAEDEHT